MPRRIGTDESAVTSLPFRLTVSGILFAVILLLSSVYLFDFLEEAKENAALNEISKLTAAAEQLSLHGEGSEISLELRLPTILPLHFQILSLMGPYPLLQAGTGSFSLQSSNQNPEDYSYLFPKKKAFKKSDTQEKICCEKFRSR